MTETTARIRWEPTKYGGWTGRVGTLEPWAFQIFKTGLGYAGWSLTAQLHGSFGAMGEDPDELKADAERLLEEFASSLGAVFPSRAAADLRSRADEMESYTDGGAEGRHDRSMFATGMRRSADLIERGDVPAEPPPPHPEEGCTCPCGCPAPGQRDDDGTPGWCDSCRMNIHVEAAKAAGEKE